MVGVTNPLDSNPCRKRFLKLNGRWYSRNTDFCSNFYWVLQTQLVLPQILFGTKEPYKRHWWNIPATFPNWEPLTILNSILTVIKATTEAHISNTSDPSIYWSPRTQNLSLNFFNALSRYLFLWSAQVEAKILDPLGLASILDDSNSQRLFSSFAIAVSHSFLSSSGSFTIFL